MNRPTHVAVLLLIVAVAVTVRAVGIGYLLPQRRENDSYILEQAEILGGLERLPTLTSDEILITKYPHLLPWMLVPIAKVEAEAAPLGRDASLDDHLALAARPVARARRLLALLSALLVPVTYLLWRRLTGHSGVGLLAAAFVAVDLMHVVFSQQARPHGPFATFAVAAVWIMIELRRRPTVGRYLLAGTLSALALGCLHFGAFLALPLLVAHLTRERSGGRAWPRLLVAALPVLIAIPAFYPFVLPGGTGELKSHRFDVISWYVDRLAVAHMHLVRNEPYLLALAAIGLLLVIARTLRCGRPTLTQPRTKDALVVASFAVPFYVGVGGVLIDQYRFLLSLLPILAGLAAIPVIALMDRCARHGGVGRMVAAALCALALSPPAYVAVRLTTLHREPDTMDLTARWLEENGDRSKDAVLVQSNLALPFLYWRDNITPELLHTGFKVWEEYQVRWRDQLALGTGWNIQPFSDIRSRSGPMEERLDALIESSRARYLVLRACPWDEERWMLQHARERYRRVAVIPAVDPSRDVEVLQGFQDPDLLGRVIHGVAWGPPIEVFAFDPPRRTRGG